jgi:hypothetical protein
MTKRRVAICPKCESFRVLQPNQVEAWCQHFDSKFGPPETDADVEKIPCKIIEVEE